MSLSRRALVYVCHSSVSQVGKTQPLRRIGTPAGTSPGGHLPSVRSVTVRARLACCPNTTFWGTKAALWPAPKPRSRFAGLEFGA